MSPQMLLSFRSQDNAESMEVRPRLLPATRGRFESEVSSSMELVQSSFEHVLLLDITSSPLQEDVQLATLTCSTYQKRSSILTQSLWQGFWTRAPTLRVRSN